MSNNKLEFLKCGVPVSSSLIIVLVILMFISIPLAFGARSGLITLRMGAYPPTLTASVVFNEPSGNRLLDAVEKAVLRVTLKNTGKGDAFGVKVNLSSISRQKIKGLTVPESVSVGSISAGKTKVVEIPLVAGEELENGSAKIRLDFTEEVGFDADSVVLTFGTKELLPPNLQVVDVGVADTSQNGRIEPAEMVEITVRIQNRGQGEAKGVTAQVDLGENVFPMYGTTTNFTLGNMKSGQYQDIKFNIYTNKRIKHGPIPVKVRLGEVRPIFAQEFELKQLVLFKPQQKVNELRIAGIEQVRSKSPVKDVATLSDDVDTDIPKCKTKNHDAVAVIIGNSDYDSPDVPKVNFAIRDANVVREYVEKTLGYRPGNIISVRNATFANFRAVFGSLENHQGKLFDYVKEGKSDVFIYYSGHGAPDPNTRTGYFVPTDCDPSHVDQNGYSLKTFYRNLGLLPARSIIVVLDSCFSGGSQKGMLIKSASPVFIAVEKPSADLKNTAVFASSSGDQISSWYPEKRHGLFTYFFLKGLRGEADTNEYGKQDGKIRATELYSYLKDKVPYWARRLFSGRKQTPELLGTPDAIIAELR